MIAELIFVHVTAGNQSVCPIDSFFVLRLDFFYCMIYNKNEESIRLTASNTHLCDVLSTLFSFSVNNY